MRSMRRQALKVTVQAAFGPLRVTNTHLEYYSAEQRDAQIERLLDLQQEASTYRQAADAREPYGRQMIAASGILCGDFNFDVSDHQHAMLHASSRAGLKYRDAWTICHPGVPHQPTCGLHDHVQWKNGADCRDFIFVTEDIAGRCPPYGGDGETAASDHQPVLIELADCRWAKLWIARSAGHTCPPFNDISKTNFTMVGTAQSAFAHPTALYCVTTILPRCLLASMCSKASAILPNG